MWMINKVSVNAKVVFEEERRSTPVSYRKITLILNDLAAAVSNEF